MDLGPVFAFIQNHESDMEILSNMVKGVTPRNHEIIGGTLAALDWFRTTDPKNRIEVPIHEHRVFFKDLPERVAEFVIPANRNDVRRLANRVQKISISSQEGLEIDLSQATTVYYAENSTQVTFQPRFGIKTIYTE